MRQEVAKRRDVSDVEGVLGAKRETFAEERLLGEREERAKEMEKTKEKFAILEHEAKELNQ